MAFEDPFKILLVMADQVVLCFVDENDFEKQGNGIYADVSGNRPVEKPVYK